MIEITGEKVWDDANNQDGFRPDYIYLELMADDEVVGDVTVTERDLIENVDPDEPDAWAFTFGEYPKYADGEEIEYTIKETMADSVPDDAYTSEIPSPKETEDGIQFTITNTHTPETVDVEGTKTWDDENNQDGKRPSEITIRLLADGIETKSMAVTEADGWAWSFIDLPKYESGVEITYTIAEDVVEDYVTTIDGYDVTNTYEPSKTSLNVQKIWDDADDQDGARPEEITVVLTENGDPTDQTLTLDESNGWAGTFSDLDEYTDGVKNDYSIAEMDEIEGYATTVETVEDTSTIIITNKYEPETTSLTITKDWDDAGDQDGKRPDSVTVDILANGDSLQTVTIPAVADSDTWTATVDTLPVYANGEEITYTVDEEEVEGYTADVGEVTGNAEDGFAVSITNTHEPETTDLFGTVIWVDDSDASDTRPVEVTINILANNDLVKTVTVPNPELASPNRLLAPIIQTLAATENEWEWSIEDLPMYSNGKEIEYSVEQDAITSDGVPIYDTYVRGDAAQGFRIYNVKDVYSVTNVFTNVTGNNEQTWIVPGEAYEETLTADQGYELPESITVTIGGVESTAYTYDSSTGLLTIPAEAITGDVVITVEAVAVPVYSIVLTLYDSTDYDTTLAGTGLFTLYKVVEDDDDEVVEADLITDENGQIIVEVLDAGSYYFVQTEIDNDDYTLPTNPTSKTVTIPDDLDENGVCEVTMEDDPVYVVDYAVKIWGIGADTYSYDDGETSQTAGLTFGPATGADYTNSYVSRETVLEAGGSHDSEYCIHDMTWSEIIEQSKTDPKVFEDCKTNGCTKAVKLTPNDTLFFSDAVTATVDQNFTGDGVGTLHYELDCTSQTGTTYACRWNYATATVTVDDAYTYPNVYSRSRIRTMLTGDSANIVDAVNNHNSPSGIYYTTSSPLADSSDCLLSCFPEPLQDAIVPRATSNHGGTGPYISNNHPAEDIETYDTLWLFSLTELGLSHNYDDSGGIDYGMASTDAARIAYGISSATASATSGQVWWTRSRYTSSNPTLAYAVYTTGGVSDSNSVANSCGISPCFCLPGPDEEEEGYTGTVHYAVKLWGICTDTYSEDGGDTTGTASLTFGPALGADYINSSKTCGSDTCINAIEWDDIIELCNENQGDKAALTALFGSCLENGCTKAVELTTNSTLFNTETVQNVMAQSYSGDGVSTLSNLLNTEDGSHTGLFWNLTSTGATSDADPANIYSRSRVRTSLTGDSANIENQVHSGHINYYYDDAHPLLNENNCLFSCFPENLQDAIVPREVKASENSNDVDTYDTLWLMSLSELGIPDAADNGTDYGIAKENADRVAYEFSDTDASTAEASTWWTRTRSDTYYFRVNEIAADGSNNQDYSSGEHELIGPDSGHGISPAFCLK